MSERPTTWRKGGLRGPEACIGRRYTVYCRSSLFLFSLALPLFLSFAPSVSLCQESHCRWKCQETPGAVFKTSQLCGKQNELHGCVKYSQAPAAAQPIINTHNQRYTGLYSTLYPAHCAEEILSFLKKNTNMLKHLVSYSIMPLRQRSRYSY